MRLLALSLSLIAASCKSPAVPRDAAKPVSELQGPGYPRLGIADVDGSPDLSRVTIRMLRTSCFGSCPNYRVELRGDGSGLYEGLGWVARVGSVPFTVERDVVLGILDQFEALDFWELHADPMVMHDAPVAVLELTVGKRTRSISSPDPIWDADMRLAILLRGGREEQLEFAETVEEVATWIDAALRTERWVITAE